jgi:hypothetical protein
MLAAQHFRAIGLVSDGPDGAQIGFPARLRVHALPTDGTVPELGEHDGFSPR